MYKAFFQLSKQKRFYQKVFTDLYKRSHYCGELSKNEENQLVKLCGWISHKRKLNDDLCFIVLRDVSGTVQLRMKNIPENVESVLYIEGKVEKRPENTQNKNMSTGEIEISVEKYEILNESKQLPFQYINADEDTLLKYRYLDLRRPKLQENIITRSKTMQIIRNYFISNRFLEIETPTLFKSTPEGAREYLVPTLQKGKFYALTQSPQQYKQLLMVGGLDRYFQIARCYRQESGRSDRQPEFTQVDVEMSFITQEDIITLIEGLLKEIFQKILNIEVKTPFPRMTYHHAMENYGCDKPDTRFDFKIKKLVHPLRFLKTENYKYVYYINGVGLGKLSNKESGRLTLNEENIKIYKKELPELGIGVDDILIIGYGNNKKQVLSSLNRVRLEIGKILNIEGYNFLWVVDFPLFEENDDGTISSTHHPFTSPHQDDVNELENNPLGVRGLHYDIVLNGCEIGGGSIRIHNPQVQEQVMKIIGAKKETFAHLFEAFSYGCPPHGGIALGLDRLMSLICKTKSIRDVIAFPKSMNGNESMTSAPSEVNEEQLKEVHIKVIE